MSPAAEHRSRGLESRRRIVRFPDHAGPVELGRREIRERHEEPVHLDDLAAFDDLGADPFPFEPRGNDAIGQLHPSMLPCG
jgi:hypothetical protein